MNILFITADQWRGECLSYLDHPIVKTPHLDSLAADGVLFKQHYAQATPCSPSRTSLHTGMYLFNHRCTQNGTPVSRRFTNWALEARKAGYDPSLFGYTDTAQDPNELDANDVRLTHYSEPLPGIGYSTPMRNDVSVPWVEYLIQQGYKIPMRWWDLYSERIAGKTWSDDGEISLPLKIKAKDHETHFMVDQCLQWIKAQPNSWISHLSLLRPHPPFVAPKPYNTMYSPECGVAPTRHNSKEDHAKQHPFLDYTLNNTPYACDDDERKLQEARANYYGLMAEVDDNLGRLFAELKALGQWDDTLIIFTSDHGEQMGDQWLMSKLGFYDSSYHIPLIIRDPRAAANNARGNVIEAFTENVDIMPTMLDWLGLNVPSQCDGNSLLSMVQSGAVPKCWREEVHWEYDFRDVHEQKVEQTLGLTSHQCSLSVIRNNEYKYVYFTALPPLLFDLNNDPNELNNCADDPIYASIIHQFTAKLLSWRMNHTDRGLTETILTTDGPFERRDSVSFYNK